MNADPKSRPTAGVGLSLEPPACADHAHCEGHGAHVIGLNLTPARRAILDLLCKAEKPLGAYDMLDSLAGPSGRRPAPIAVYRALDYLLENGLVHRLASRNAFVACGRRHAHSDPVAFLICDSCGRVEESASPAFALSLTETAAAAGFRSKGAVIEVSGTCAPCAIASETSDRHAREG